MSSTAVGPRAAIRGRAPGPLTGAPLIVLLGFLTMFAPLSTDMYLPALPDAGRDLAASASAVQLTLTGSLIGLGAGQLVAGPLSDSLGRRRPLLVGLLLYTLTSVACAICPSVWLLVAVRIVQGAAGAAGIVIARAIVRDMYSGTEAARIFSLLVLVMGLAPILAPLAGGQLMHVTDWRGIFLVLAAIGAILFAVTWWALGETLAPANRRAGGLAASARVFRSLFHSRAFMGNALCFGLFFGAVFSYIAGSPYIFEEIFGVSPQLFGALFGLNAAGMVIVSQVGRRLVARTGPARLLTAGLIAGAAAGVAVLVLVLAGAGIVPVAACFFVLFASFGVVAPNSTALALEGFPHVAGTASALLGAIQFAIGASVAPLVGVAGTGTAVPVAVLIALFTAAAVVARRLVATRPPTHTEPA
ncbi:MAG: transporter, family, multidrug resistance protein [Solirubrobacteraceae bacterium]|jgi:DHA1 family bicyclomycin/chloramphenicol resistance-like MFS transporter|nr:transporter, family, multidrug resistance protein [Solirubrobacteraceae bacterium]